MERCSAPFTGRTRALRTIPNRRIPDPRTETQILPSQKRVFGTSRTNIPVKPGFGKPSRKRNTLINKSEAVIGCPENPKSESDTTVVAEKPVGEAITTPTATATERDSMAEKISNISNPNISIGDETAAPGTNKITDPIAEAPETEPSDRTETTISIPGGTLETEELKSTETRTEGKKLSGDPNARMKKKSQKKVVQNQAPKTEPSHEAEPEFLIPLDTPETMELKYQTIEDSKAASEEKSQEKGAQIHAPKPELAVSLPPSLDNDEDMETRSREVESHRARLRMQKKNQSETAQHTPVALSSFPSSSMRRKPRHAEATPYHSAKQCSNCIPDRLETSSYWLMQIRLAESAGKHFASAAFFKLAFQSKAEPIKDVRIELRRYLGRHRHLRAEGKWRQVCLSFGLIKDDKNGGKPIPSSAADSGRGSC